MTSHSALAAAAADFLSDASPRAWYRPSEQLLTDVVRLFAEGQIGAAKLEAEAVTGRRPRPTIPPTGATAVLGLMGVLMPGESIFSMLGIGTSVRSFMQQLAAAGADDSVKSIVVLVDSPGGSVRQLPEAAQLMRKVRTQKPVVVGVTGMAASAAYWLASNGSAIESTPSGHVGAIGVITSRVSVARQLQQEGIDVAVITAGKHKAEGHEATPMSDAERAHIQALVDASYTDFVTDVAAGRELPVGTVRAGFGEGRLVHAREGLRLRMIDRISLIEDTVERASTTPIERTALVQSHRRELARAALSGYRQQQVRASLATHRSALAKAGRQSTE